MIIDVVQINKSVQRFQFVLFARNGCGFKSHGTNAVDLREFSKTKLQQILHFSRFCYAKGSNQGICRKMHIAR